MLVDLQPDSRVDEARDFDVDDMVARVDKALDFLRTGTPFASLPISLLSAGTAAAAALRSAANHASQLGAVACLAGRIDLAGSATLQRIETPTLLMCASSDRDSVRMHQLAFGQMYCPRKLMVVPASGCGFDDRRALEDVAALTIDWFKGHLAERSLPCLSYRG